MNDLILDLDALTVETFETESTSAFMANGFNCTGCDSGCGIFPNDP
jgi:hypothetical protein